MIYLVEANIRRGSGGEEKGVNMCILDEGLECGRRKEMIVYEGCSGERGRGEKKREGSKTRGAFIPSTKGRNIEGMKQE